MTPTESVEAAIEDAQEFLSDMPGQLDERSICILLLAMGALSKKTLSEDTVIELLSKALFSKPRKRGGDPFINSTRNICIVGAVHHIHHKFGFGSARSNGARESACSIVTKAIGRLKSPSVVLNLSEDAVDRIWLEGKELYAGGAKGASAMARLIAKCKAPTFV
jgi:hypothetical protein